MISILKSVWSYTGDPQRLIFYIACNSAILILMYVLESNGTINELILNRITIVMIIINCAVWVDWPRIWEGLNETLCR